MLNTTDFYTFYTHNTPTMPHIKQKGSVDVSRALRAAIITLRVVAKYSFDAIHAALGIPRSTCSSIFARAVAATGNEDIIDLLDYIHKENNRQASGLAVIKVWPSSPASIAIQDAAWWYPKETWEEAVKNHTPFSELSRATIEKICRTHPHPGRDRPLTRVLEIHKPSLSSELRELRVDYANWCLFWLDKGALFVFTDETYISAGGRPHKRQRVTIEQGEQPESRSRGTDPIYFKIMLWGAICEDTEIPFPSLCWEWETPEEKAKHQLELDLENLTQRQIALQHQIAARQAGTIESQILGEVNNNNQLYNEQRRAAGHTKGMRRRRKPEQVFKHKPLERGEKSKGIDWFLYRKFVLHDKLFPYIRKLHEKYPGRPIVVVEDGAPLHTKAIGICEAEYAAEEIIRAPHTPNSPDMNQVEPVWDYLKDMLDGRFDRSMSKEAVTEGRALIADEWSRTGPKAKQLCSSFRAKLLRVIKLNGGNNYHG
ncbi:hypothetical protein NX059_012519 [Plenodomus lindquistii]|nr:hypothetical protein NX059_012519 [Plenodomus lindquistii]